MVKTGAFQVVPKNSCENRQSQMSKHLLVCPRAIVTLSFGNGWFGNESVFCIYEGTLQWDPKYAKNIIL